MSERALHLVLGGPAAGREKEYETWSESRLERATGVAGVASARRYTFVPHGDDDAPLRPDLAVLELETDDLAATHAELSELWHNPAADPEATLAWSLAEIAERRTDGGEWRLANPHLFFVWTAPVAGLEGEFEDWYTNRHLADVLELPSYRSGQRFRHTAGADPLRPFLALYETDTTDVSATQQALMEAVATPAMPLVPAVDRSQSVFWYYRLLSAARVAPPAAVGTAASPSSPGRHAAWAG